MIRARRKLLRFSQEKLAGMVGVTFQQIQKYEKASNRVSCSMLVKIACALDCQAGELLPATEGQKVDLGPELRLAGEPGGRELCEAYLQMPSHFRTSLLSIARALGVRTAQDQAMAARAA
ncbi:MAG: helix-turn-helix transcriptional regulator [Phenylobacterium sp.]|nr:helix-turn-helix transcriptional regulator [Phenylobacterium sp.]